jgi:hypothetical protein
MLIVSNCKVLEYEMGLSIEQKFVAVSKSGLEHF